MKEINLDEIKLKASSHKSFEDGACIMEMVSYMADEPWSDRPQCACPILTNYAIRLNDTFNDDDRQKMKPLIPRLINTRMNDETQIARKRFIMWRNVTSTYGFILDTIGAKEFADKIRTFKNTESDMEEAAKWLKDNREAIRKIADANADANAIAYAYTYANAIANADVYADVYAYANADTYAYAYAYTYAYAYAYAKKFRSDLSDISIETLSMAIDVKVENKQ